MSSNYKLILLFFFFFFFQCDDETCKYTTRSLNLQLVGDSEKGTVCPNYPRCNGRLVRKVYIANLVNNVFFFFFPKAYFVMARAVLNLACLMLL